MVFKVFAFRILSVPRPSLGLTWAISGPTAALAKPSWCLMGPPECPNGLTWGPLGAPQGLVTRPLRFQNESWTGPDSKSKSLQKPLVFPFQIDFARPANSPTCHANSCKFGECMRNCSHSGELVRIWCIFFKFVQNCANSKIIKMCSNLWNPRRPKSDLEGKMQ